MLFRIAQKTLFIPSIYLKYRNTLHYLYIFRLLWLLVTCFLYWIIWLLCLFGYSVSPTCLKYIFFHFCWICKNFSQTPLKCSWTLQAAEALRCQWDCWRNLVWLPDFTSKFIIVVMWLIQKQSSWVMDCPVNTSDSLENPWCNKIVVFYLLR